MLPDNVRATEIETSPYVEFTDAGLAFAKDTPYPVWEAVFGQLKEAEKHIRWWLGDALNFAENHYGNKYTQALEDTDYSYDTLSKSAQVANAFEIGRRRPILSFAHHQAVKSLERDEQDEVLGLAEDNGWNLAKTREEVKERKTMPANPTRGGAQVVKAVRCPHCNGTGEIIEEI